MKLKILKIFYLVVKRKVLAMKNFNLWSRISRLSTIVWPLGHDLRKIFIGGIATLLFCSALVLLFFQFSMGTFLSIFGSVAKYVYAAPYATSPSGTVKKEYETLPMSGSYITLPTKGNSGDSTKFGGFKVYEYFYPANPEKNTDDRKVLYSYYADGRVEVGGNLVVQGSRTQLRNEYGSGNMALSSYKSGNTKPGNQIKKAIMDSPAYDDSMAGIYLLASTEEKKTYTSYVTTEPRSNDVYMSGGAILNKSWNKKDDSGLGPSVFVNPESAKLEKNNANMASTKKDIVIETNFNPAEGFYYWEEFFAKKDGPKLSDPTALFSLPPILYVADMGNRQISLINTLDNSTHALGGADWNWVLNGIVADNEYIYVTDSARDIVIRTSIGGQDWLESFRDIDDYQSRLYLEGSEHFKVVNPVEATAAWATIYDCGYNNHEVFIYGTPTAQMNKKRIGINPATQKPLMLSTEGCAFGNACFSFNGFEYIKIDDSAAWNFGDDMFTIDMWAKFTSLDFTMSLVSHPGSYLFEWDNDVADLASPALVFAFINEDRGADGNYTFQTFASPWIPELGLWYHLAIVRSEQNELVMYVDGEVLGNPVPITGRLRDSEGGFQIGAYEEIKTMVGQIDEIRVARGSDWRVDYSDYYKLDDPQGIIIAPNGDGTESLYVVDSGHGRIVKMDKEFHGWSTFGEQGSGDFQFNRPTDIYYFGGSFYITDTGNKRVVKANMAQMVHYLKGESGGTWEVVYSSDSPDLHGVMVDAGNIIITDAYNGQIIKNGEVIGSKNPWDLLFRFTSPVDIQPGLYDRYYVLDGTSNYDFSSDLENRSMDLYGSAQKESINVRFNEGGVMTENIRNQGVVARLNHDGVIDPLHNQWNSWVGDELGPGVAHCPIEPSLDGVYAGNCSGGGAWTGLGTNVDCNNPNNAPPSECVGQWDWEEDPNGNIIWKTCIRYKPAYDLVSVCDDPKLCKVNGKDEVCGCNNTVNDCFTYCQAEDLDCHEGYAVAYKFYENGPPLWYLQGPWNKKD